MNPRHREDTKSKSRSFGSAEKRFAQDDRLSGEFSLTVSFGLTSNFDLNCQRQDARSGCRYLIGRPAALPGRQ
jgi:hypothetical protein